jgi:cell division protein FtsL
MELCPRSENPGKSLSRPASDPILASSVLDAARAEKRAREKGAGHTKAIIWTMILVAFIYVAAVTLPVLVNEYQFQDTLQEIARFASVNRRTNDQVQKAVLEEAQKEDLPVQAEDIKVAGAGGNVHINVDYSVTIDLKVYQWTLNFHPAASNASLL